MKLSNNISLDWLSFTIPYTDENMARARELGAGAELQEQSFGRFRYNASTKMLDGAHIYYNPDRKDMGIHVAINAASLAMMDYRPLQLVTRIRHWGSKIKRMDIAFDDYDGLLDVDAMYGKIRRGEVVTRFRTVSRISGGKVGNEEKTGDTVNLGRRSSESFIRIYDKGAEQLARKKTLPDGVETWVRVELEIKGDKAHAVAELLGDTTLVGVTSASQEASNLLYGLLDFKEPGPTDTNKSRWTTSDWWLEFVRATGKRKLSMPKKDKSLEASKVWLKNQVGATIAMIILSEPDDNGQSGWDFVVECAIEGEVKIKEAQQKRLDEYNERQRQKREAEKVQ